jgi:hypothetical protein
VAQPVTNFALWDNAEISELEKWLALFQQHATLHSRPGPFFENWENAKKAHRYAITRLRSQYEPIEKEDNSFELKRAIKEGRVLRAYSDLPNLRRALMRLSKDKK